jgi:hypothetical protein
MASAPTFVPIASYTIPSSMASYTFNSIPQTYTDLYIVDNTTQTSGSDRVDLIFNGDTGSSYSVNWVFTDTSAIHASNGTVGSSAAYTSRGDTTKGLGYTHILGYKDTDKYKLILSKGVDGSIAVMWTSMWRSTSAITSITFRPISNFIAGSTITLYGIKAA